MKQSFVACTFGLTVAGCYTLQPISGLDPLVGSQVAFDVNDAGRVALGGSMGPEISQIEGRLVQRDTDQYVVAVSAVHLLRGGEQPWTGESVRIKSAYVGTSYQRRFSPGRTAALSAVGVAALALLAGRSLLGAGATDRPVVPGDTAKAERRPGSSRIPQRSSPLQRLPQTLLPHLRQP